MIQEHNVRTAVALDGIPWILVDSEDLDDDWAQAQGWEKAYPGLITPGDLEMRVHPRLHNWVASSTRLEIRDLTPDGELGRLIGGGTHTEAESLLAALEPGAEPPASLWNKWVGLEKIGPAGERRQYSCVPGFDVGMHHIGSAQGYYNVNEAAMVSDRPLIHFGRRAVVYRVEMKPNGEWQTLAEATMLTLLTMRAVEFDRSVRRWWLNCAGPESWLGATLSREKYQEPIRVRPITAIADDHTTMLGSVEIVSIIDLSQVGHTYVEQMINADYLEGTTSYDDVADAVGSFLSDLEKEGGQESLESPNGAGRLRYEKTLSNDGVAVKWNRTNNKHVNADGWAWMLRLTLTMHETVWAKLGYDPRAQNSDRDPVSEAEQYGRFRPVVGASGWFTGEFWSANAEACKAWEAGDVSGLASTPHATDNGGAYRRWPPLWPGGAVLFTGQPGQEFQMVTYDPVYIEGQNNRPLMSDGADGPYRLEGDPAQAVTDHGLLLLEGPYRARGQADDDATTLVQVVRVCWRQTPEGTVALDSKGWPRFVIYEWLRPRLLGMEHYKLMGTWGTYRAPPPNATGIRARPISVLDYSGPGDLVETVLQRMLLSTGTAGGWFTDGTFTTPKYGTAGNDFAQQPGANEPDETGAIPRDAEVADLGLGIPKQLVAPPSEWAKVSAGIGKNLKRCKASFLGEINSRQVLARLTKTMGLCPSFRGGRFGWFDPCHWGNPDDIDLFIDAERFADSIKVRQRSPPWAPIDQVQVHGRINPLTGDYHAEFVRRSPDAGAKYRAVPPVRAEVHADHLVHPGLTSTAGSNWSTEMIHRWEWMMRFWSRTHYQVTVPIPLSEGLDLWPGSRVAVSDDYLYNPSGSYGFGFAVGYVTRRVANPRTQVMVIDAVVTGETDLRLYGPGAHAWWYDANTQGLGYRLGCHDDMYKMRKGETFDVEGFAEPAWSKYGGHAKIEVFQSDLVREWGGCYATVTGVHVEPGNCWLQLDGPPTGERLFRDTVKLVGLVRQSEQPAEWARRIYGAIGDATGKVNGQPVPRFI